MGAVRVRSNPYAVTAVDAERRTVSFRPPANGKKITGSKLAAILGKDAYTSQFRAACDIARLYTRSESTKYTEAGEAIEPVIRSYVREHGRELLGGFVPEGEAFGVENPVDKADCGYDHFRSVPRYGGMVDGYIRIGSRRAAVLEIKTAGDRSKWTDSRGRICRVPENYMYQASLYAGLSGLEDIVFAVGFLEERDYEDPASWIPDGSNLALLRVDPLDLTYDMQEADRWYERHILGGVTPPWTDADADIVECLTTARPDFVSGELTRKVSEYLSSQPSPGRDALLAEIGAGLAQCITGSFGSLEYEQGGRVFRVSKDGSVRVSERRRSGRDRRGLPPLDGHVPDVEQGVGEHQREAEAVEREDVVHVPGDELVDDPADVPDEQGDQEGEALPAGAPGLPGPVDRERPCGCEAEEHHYLEYAVNHRTAHHAGPYITVSE